MKIYSVINMDIVNSRKIENRKEIQVKLKEYFETINNKYSYALIAPITFTLGDEWQIVLKDVKESYNIFCDIKKFLLNSNVKCYSGIGIGKMSTRESKDTREMDGEAFIYARDAINSVKKSNVFYNKDIYTKDCKVLLKGNNIDINDSQIRSNYYSIMDSALMDVAITIDDENSLLNMCQIVNVIMQNNETIENKFTDKQREIISIYEEVGSYNEIEKKYPQFSKSGISHKLTTSNYFLTLYNKKIIYNLLDIYSKVLREREYGV